MDAFADQLSAFRRRRDYLIGVDSDGCVFDTMALKHQACFAPNTIAHFGLESVASEAREAADFVNLHSRWRGINRFPGLIKTLDLLAVRDSVVAAGVSVPRLDALRGWLAGGPRLGHPSLADAVGAATGAARDELQGVLDWSVAVNRDIERLVQGVAPFASVRASLARAAARADIVVVSATPCEALEREWAEHDLRGYVSLIAGQEMGPKADHLAVAAREGYAPDRALMIGDAPGDLDAARRNGALFYPIMPGAEAASWDRFLAEGLERFLAGTYGGAYEAALVEAFESLLPESPPWSAAAP